MNKFYLKECELNQVSNFPDAFAAASKNTGMNERLLNELNAALPGAASYFEFRKHEDGSVYFLGNYLGYERNGVHYFIKMDKYQRKYLYYFHSPESYDLVYNNSFLTYLQCPKEPNRIGVFTRKKIESWFKHIDEERAFLKEEIRKAEAFREDWLKRMEDEKIVWKDKNQTEGRIERNGIIFKFQFTGCQIYQQIELSWREPRNYDLFKALADNSYQAAPM